MSSKDNAFPSLFESQTDENAVKNVLAPSISHLTAMERLKAKLNMGVIFTAHVIKHLANWFKIT